MKRTCLGLAIVTLLAAVGVMGQEGSNERRIGSNGYALATQVRASDRRLVLLIGPDKPLTIAPPDGVSLERFSADVSDFVVVLRVENVRSRAMYLSGMDLTAVERTSDSVPATPEKANWIQSMFETRLQRVLKGAPALTQGDEFVFTEDGGTTTIKGVQIEARSSWMQPMTGGKRYLVFGSLSTSGQLVRTWVYEEPYLDGPLTNLASDDAHEHRLVGLSMDQAIAFVESEMRK